VGKHQCLEFDESGNWQPVHIDEERCGMRSLRLLKNHSCCSILDPLQRFDSACRKACQESKNAGTRARTRSYRKGLIFLMLYKANLQDFKQMWSLKFN